MELGLKTEKREIDGLVFHITQFPARKCLKLEKRTLTHLAPMLTMLEGMKLDDDIDFSKIVKGIQDVLTNIDENTLEQYILDMLALTSIVVKNEKGQDKYVALNTEQIFDATFVGKNITVFKLLLAIMKVNKFAFFELMGGGGEITGIFGQMMPKPEIS